MATERDNAFSSTGTGGSLDQGGGIGSSTGDMGADRVTGIENGQSEPALTRARGAVSNAGHKAAERVQERIADQVHRASDQLETVASSLRSASEQMPQDGMGRYMLQAATQVDNLATFLDNREVTELFDEVEDFARRQPAVFIGGAFALGVLGARFLRSSRQNMGLDSHRDWRSDGYGLNDGTYGRSGASGLSGLPSADRAGTGYGSGYQAGAEIDDTGISSGSSRMPGAGDTMGNRDFASDRPDQPRNFEAGRSGTAGAGNANSLGSSQGMGTSGAAGTGSPGGIGGSRSTSPGGSTGYSPGGSSPASGAGTGFGASRTPDSSRDRSPSDMAGRSDRAADGDTGSEDDSELRGMPRSPDFL